MFRTALIVLSSPMIAVLTLAQSNVRVNASMPRSPRALEARTLRDTVRDYLQSWKAMGSAFDQNRADVLGEDFVGRAMQELTNTLKEQTALGIHTHYQDISHNIQFLFYSPEGSSIEFSDLAKFKVQVFDRGHLVSNRLESAHYIVVMTPAEARWSIRIFQAVNNSE
jgi:hypothetical protein